jgi:NAD(P)-dependent dehydrogenase (short-subunit alcohol dehydrogenase family)
MGMDTAPADCRVSLVVPVHKEFMMKIAVTAASGQLGRAIVKATAALIGNQNVIGIARSAARSPRAQASSAES